MKILLASNNKHKQKEMQQIFDAEAPGKIELIIPDDIFDKRYNVEENADTLEGNAFLKAQAFFELAEMPVIADDTGLEIDALKGAPGVHSARYAGEHGDDEANRRKVLSLITGVPEERRGAQFRTVICFIETGEPIYVDGKCKGKIIEEERGSAGFGYDPIFIPEGYDKTFAEMPAEEKNKISHRANAALNLIKLLKAMKEEF